MYNLYGNMFGNFNEFDNVFTQITDESSVMIINNRENKKLSYLTIYDQNDDTNSNESFDNLVNY